VHCFLHVWHRFSQKLELGGRTDAEGPQIDARGREWGESGVAGALGEGVRSEPPPYHLGLLGKRCSLQAPQIEPRSQTFLGHEKDMKMHIAGITFVSFTAQICIYQIPTEVGRAVTRSPWLRH